MIKFQCRTCGHKIGIGEQYAGKKGKCPKCQSINVIPSISKKSDSELPQESPQKTLSDSSILEDFILNAEKQSPKIETAKHYGVVEKTKNCPFCGEEILDRAVKCKHCGEFLDGRGSVAASPQTFAAQKGLYENTARQQNNYQEYPSQGNETCGILLLIIPIISSLLIWFWVGEMALIDRPMNKLNMIIILTIVSTCILIAIDASSLGVGQDLDGKRRTGPIGWFFCGLLLWVFSYPAYLYQRSRYGAKNFCIIGIFSMLIFMGVSIMMGIMIEEAMASVQQELQELEDMFGDM